MQLTEKEGRYRELVSRILTNKAQVGSGLYQIGLDLKEIKERELYLCDFPNTFEEFLEKKVSISRTNAYRLIMIAENFSLRDFEKWGMSKLELINKTLQIQEEKEKFLQKGHPSVGIRSLEREMEDFSHLNRLSKAISKKELQEEEQKLKLIRQFEALKRTKETLKIAFNSWIETALKYEKDEQISPLIAEGKEIWQKL